MTRTTPARRITLQCSQIGLTLLRTFIAATSIEFLEQLGNIAPYTLQIKSTPRAGRVVPRRDAGPRAA